MQNISRKPTDIFLSNEKLYVISKSGSGDVLIFNTNLTLLSKKYEIVKWRPIENLTEFGCISCKYDIFIIGGYCVKSKQCSAKILKYNTLTEEWTKDLSSMKLDRRLCSAALVGSDIYVIGGFKSNGKMLSTTEIFNVSRNKWRRGPSFIKPRADIQLVNNGSDSLLAIGGLKMSQLNQQSVVCSCDNILELELLNSNNIGTRQAWIPLDENEPIKMGKPAYQHSVLIEAGRLFIIGGLRTMIQSDHSTLTEEINQKYCESFILNPINLSKSPHSQSSLRDENSFNRDWISPWSRDIGFPAYSRYGASLVSVGMSSRDLFLIGGCNTQTDNSEKADKNEVASKGVKVVERYNLSRSKWTEFMNIDNEEVDLSSIISVKIPSPNYDFSPMFSNNDSNMSQDEATNETEEEKMYRVGWILW